MSADYPIMCNERAMASAGSGKTYALVNRYIALCLQSPPERICALTFTRKAAGEFLDRILSKLALAACDVAAAEKLSNEIWELSGARFGIEDFGGALKKMAHALPRLKLSTIDAFCAQLLRAFSAELGLAGDAEVLDDFGARKARLEALGYVFESLAQDGELFNEFAEAVKRASFGFEEKSLENRLENYIASAHGLYIDFPELSRWGMGGAYESARFEEGRYEEAVGLLERLADGVKAFDGAVKFFKNSRPGKISDISSKALEAVAKNYSENPRFEEGFSFDYSRKQISVSAETASVLSLLLNMLIGAELAAVSKSAASIGRIMRLYENAYSRTVRRAGRLTFSDMAMLLASPEARFARPLIEYRMDSRIDYWLFDEFQDTSRAQWGVFENLIDEVLQDDGGKRTFYYVGDVKQSIYRWRGGAPELFEEIFKKYRGRIREAQPLDASWRSVPCVIDAVNAIFGDEELLKTQYREDAVQDWSRVWRNHASARGLLAQEAAQRGQAAAPKELCGCVGFINKEKNADAPALQIYELLRAVNPVGRGLSCAVLTQKNKTATAIIESIKKIAAARAEEMPVGGDLDVEIFSDNMAGAAILQYLKLAAHPCDSAARGYVEMTPLKPLLTANEDFSFAAAQKIARGGFALLIAELAAALKASGAKDAFTLRRLSQFEEAARSFDARQSKDIDEFLSYAASCRLRESSAAQTVQVMSIHKSKGLDFDIVILPELSAEGISGGLCACEFEGEERVLNMPKASVRAFSAPLKRAWEKLERRAHFDDLCRFYVGVTRAKRAVYFFKNALKSEGAEGAADFSKLIYSLFENAGAEIEFAGMPARFLAGSNANWFEHFEKAPQVAARAPLGQDAAVTAKTLALCAPRGALKRRAPSGGGASGSYAVKLGASLHAALENVERARTPQEALSKALEKLKDDSVRQTAARILKNFFEEPAVFEIFNPPANAEIWRERNFDAVCDNEILSGVFDRVLILRGGGGEIARIIIADFKSGAHLDDAALKEKYLPQMSAYKSAMASLAGVDENLIECRILALIEPRVLKVL